MASSPGAFVIGRQICARWAQIHSYPLFPILDRRHYPMGPARLADLHLEIAELHHLAHFHQTELSAGFGSA